MRLHILFGMPEERYPGELGPDALLVWDEYCIENSPESYEQELGEAKDRHRNAYIRFEVIAVDVDGEAIRRLMTQTPRVYGTVAGLSEEGQ